LPPGQEPLALAMPSALPPGHLTEPLKAPSSLRVPVMPVHSLPAMPVHSLPAMPAHSLPETVQP